MDVVVRERAAILQLLAREDQPLLVRGDALLVLLGSRHGSNGRARGESHQERDSQLSPITKLKTNLDLLLDVLDGVRGLHVEGDGLARQSLDEDLHAAAQPQHQVERRLLEEEEVVVVER